MELNYDELLHTASRHIDISDKELRDRIMVEPIPYASRFVSKDMAIKAMSAVLTKKHSEIKEWTENKDLKRIEFSVDFKNKIGEGIAKGANYRKLYPMHRLTMVLELGYSSDHYIIVTAYPTPTAKQKLLIQQDIDEFRRTKKRP